MLSTLGPVVSLISVVLALVTLVALVAGVVRGVQILTQSQVQAPHHPVSLHQPQRG